MMRQLNGRHLLYCFLHCVHTHITNHSTVTLQNFVCLDNVSLTAIGVSYRLQCAESGAIPCKTLPLSYEPLHSRLSGKRRRAAGEKQHSSSVRAARQLRISSDAVAFPAVHIEHHTALHATTADSQPHVQHRARVASVRWG